MVVNYKQHRGGKNLTKRRLALALGFTRLVNEMRVNVIEDYATPYPNPITFDAGEIVQIGKRDDEYTGWIWAKTKAGLEGWAPEQYLMVNYNSAEAKTTKAYSAKELTIHVGEILKVHTELNEWYWVSNSADESGWIPAKKVKRI